ncbi:neuronal PAS domain-containing protein 4 isoform X1 [Pantherophis guttatus]|uniref:Neuronal PAS domain-containing protein 4 isoform X1 n=1 Tax=Pantherophis guttatus TaxID=94885 RepID=A0A6P9CBX0_PANGU|nr:neuronal PAS domain-containing protein 4 isoform X1 [Pantherophis guttatus]
MYRSTKGASKARRDQINAEIRHLKDLLPIAEGDKLRLSYLHIMSLACIYTRKSIFFSRGETLEGLEGLLSSLDLDDFMQTLPGFLLAFTGEGKLIYVSETVTEHLGHSMVDLVAQGDSIYDIIDPVDHFVMKTQLALPSPLNTERLFRCHFNTSKTIRRQSAGNKLVLIRGHFHQPPPGSYWSTNPVFTAFCTPLDPKPRMGQNSFFLSAFESRHTKDLAIVDISESVIFHLGFEKSELFCKSWYGLIHPEDLSHASAQHYRLLGDQSNTQTEMVIRLQAKDGVSWIWIYSLLRLETAEIPIVSHNYVISDSEAWCLKQQISAEGSQGPYGLESTTTFLESLLSPGQLSSPDQVFTPVAGTPTATLVAPTFDFSTAGVPEGPSAFGEPPEGLPEEMMEPGNISSIEDAPPGSSLSLLVKEPGFGYLVLPQGGYGQTFASEKPGGKSASKDLLCTPPYTPHQSSAFLFGAQELYGAHGGGGPAALPPGTAASGANSPAGLTAVTELFYAQEPCNVLYEKLPPTPDSPGNGGCVVMSLPEIRGPLYVDVPMVPEGILTPEASPIKQTFFRYSEKEKNEIELLAQQICSLAETFGSTASQELAEDGHGALREVPPCPGPELSPVPEPCPDFQLPKTWRSIDFSLLTCLEDDNDLLEENALETFLQDLSPFLFEKGGAGMRCPRHQFCGGDVSSPIGLDTEDSSPGAFAPSPRMDSAPQQPCFLEDLTSFETAFETRASNSPCDGLDELYQLQSQRPKGFQEDGSENDSSF